MIRKIFILFIILLSVLPIFSQQNEASKERGGSSQNQWTGSQEQKLYGLMTIWAEAKFNFPYFDRIPNVNWDEKVQEYIPRVLDAKDLESYYDVLREFAAVLKDGHTSVTPPWGPFGKPGNDIPPIEIQVMENRFLVARTGDNEEIKKNKIYPGLEIIEIGEQIPVRRYLQDKVLRFRSLGTSQADESIGTIDLFGGPKDSKLMIKVKDIDGFLRDVTLTRNSTNRDGSPFQWRFVKWFISDPLIESRMIEEDICYFKISNFNSENVVTEFQKVFDKLDLSKIRGIILDVRYNLGGDSNNADAIAGFLTDKPLETSKWKSLSYVPAYRSWGRGTEWIEGKLRTVEPRNGKRFLGPLVILTGPSTFSSAEDFLVVLQYSKRAKLVGEKTGGSTGNPIVVPLPGGGRFSVVSKRDMFPDGKEFVGIGILPDVEVHPAPQDLISGSDSVLEKGIEIIKNQATLIK